MKPAHFLGVGLLLWPLGLAAQSAVSPGSGQNPSLVVQETRIGPDALTTSTLKPPNSCPVGLRAEHRADGNMVRTGSAHPKGPGQRVHLTLTSPGGRAMVNATFTVRGWTAEARMEQARQSHGAPPAVQILQAPLVAGTNRTATADLWLPGFTAVTSVELLAVTYADGSLWSPPAGKTCRVQPDPFMLIAR